MSITDVYFRAYDFYFWIPIVCPITGGILGAGTYLLLLEKTPPKPSSYHLVNGLTEPAGAETGIPLPGSVPA